MKSFTLRHQYKMALFAMPLFIALFMVGCQSMGSVDNPAAMQLSAKEKQLIDGFNARGHEYTSGLDYIYKQLGNQSIAAHKGQSTLITSEKSLNTFVKQSLIDFINNQHSQEEIRQMQEYFASQRALVEQGVQPNFSGTFKKYQTELLSLPYKDYSPEEFTKEIDKVIQEAVQTLSNENEEAAFVAGATNVKFAHLLWLKNREMLNEVKVMTGIKVNKNRFANTNSVQNCNPGQTPVYHFPPVVVTAPAPSATIVIDLGHDPFHGWNPGSSPGSSGGPINSLDIDYAEVFAAGIGGAGGAVGIAQAFIIFPPTLPQGVALVVSGAITGMALDIIHQYHDYRKEQEKTRP